MDLSKLRKAVKQRRINWNKHILKRMLERGISRKEVFEVMLEGEVIEDYPDDKPFPSALIFGKVGKNQIGCMTNFPKLLF